MRYAMQIAVILVLAGTNAQAAHDPRPADVTVYVNGDALPPNLVEYGARATVTWMYARIGVRLAWRNDAARGGAVSASPVSIQVRYATDSPNHVNRDALAFALPFADGVTAITVMYQRIRMATGRPSHDQSLLAHVLAHEIGHVLMGTDSHAQTGVMKARWNGQDFDAMTRTPFEFTPGDVAMIVRGLTVLKARAGSERYGAYIMRPSGN